MAEEQRIQVQGFVLSDIEERRIRHDLATIEQRLAPYGEPYISLVLRWHPDQRLVRARLRVQLGHLGPHLVSARKAETADQAVDQASKSVLRQLERRLAAQRGEPSFGVPSRREPAPLRQRPAEPDVSEEPGDLEDFDDASGWPEEDRPAGH